MYNPKEILKKRLRIAIPLVFVFSFLWTVLLAALGQDPDAFFTWKGLIGPFFASKNAWKWFLAIAVSLSLLFTYFITKYWKKSLYDDKLGKKREFSLNYQPYGDAHWADPAEYSEFAKVRPIEKCQSIVLGQLTKDGKQCIDFDPISRLNRHILCVGASGTGKSFSFVRPYILQSIKMRHSLIITDPKGELYQQTAGILADNGYLVRRLDLITLDKSDGWDCMKFLRNLSGDELETNAEVFAKIIITNIESDDDSVYARGSVALLKALLLYTCLSPNIPDNERNIKTVNMMLQQSGVEYFNDIFGASAPLVLQPAISAYKTFKQASPNLYGNIVSHLATGLEILQTKSVEKILTTDDIDLNLPGDQPCAYFCRFSATNSTFRFVSAMFFSMLFISLIDHADRNPNKKLDVETEFLMDEFASIGTIPSWLEKISTIRSYGITAVMIVQGLSQLEDNYGPAATMIQGNCSTVINIGLNDQQSAEWFEKRMGVASIIVQTERKEGQQDSRLSARRTKGRSVSVGRDNLMSVSDIYGMDIDDMLIIFQHKNPIYAHKIPVTLFPEFENCRVVSDDDVPSIEDAAARRLRREEEEKRIAAYNEAHKNDAPPENDDTYEKPIDFSNKLIPEIVWIIIKDDLKKLFRGNKKKEPETAPEKIEKTVVTPSSIVLSLDDEDPDDLWAEDAPSSAPKEPSVSPKMGPISGEEPKNEEIPIEAPEAPSGAQLTLLEPTENTDPSADAQQKSSVPSSLPKIPNRLGSRTGPVLPPKKK